jgi:hypothetical protein
MSGPDRLVLLQNNDETLTLFVSDPSLPLVNGQPAPFNLTGCTVTFARKASQATPDTDASFRSYSGTIISAAAGTVSVAVPGIDNATPGISWWRLDVVKTGSLRTANYGPLEVRAV